MKIKKKRKNYDIQSTDIQYIETILPKIIETKKSFLRADRIKYLSRNHHRHRPFLANILLKDQRQVTLIEDLGFDRFNCQMVSLLKSQREL